MLLVLLMTSTIWLVTLHGPLRQGNLSAMHLWNSMMSCICCMQLILAELVIQTSALKQQQHAQFHSHPLLSDVVAWGPAQTICSHPQADGYRSKVKSSIPSFLSPMPAGVPHGPLPDWLLPGRGC